MFLIVRSALPSLASFSFSADLDRYGWSLITSAPESNHAFSNIFRKPSVLEFFLSLTGANDSTTTALVTGWLSSSLQPVMATDCSDRKTGSVISASLDLRCTSFIGVLSVPGTTDISISKAPRHALEPLARCCASSDTPV